MSNYLIFKRFAIGIFAIACLFSALTFIEYLTANGLPSVIAKESGSFHELLQTLEADIDNGKAELYFRFVTPISGDETEWTIPGYDAVGNYISRNISEVGDDYICFIERFGEVIMENCTPFSNIASVKHIE